MPARPRWLCCLMALALLAIAAAPARAEAPLAPDIARIVARGTLVVAAGKSDTPPFFYTDDRGQPAGIDVELAADIARRLGVTLRYARIADTFDDLPGLIAERKADVAISYLTRTLRRAAVVRFTQPYARLRQTLMASRTKTAPLFKGADRVEALDDPTVVIGVDAGAYLDFATERLPKAQVRVYATTDAAVADLLAGNLHAVMVDEGYSRSLNYPVPGMPRTHIPQDWALYIKTIVLSGARDPIAMAVHGDDHAWLAWLDTYIADRQEDGTLERIAARYLGGPAR